LRLNYICNRLISIYLKSINYSEKLSFRTKWGIWTSHWFGWS